MALGPRLEFRQSQSLVMTPQLLQAIKLLQLSSVELAAYVEEELERNPLLERAESDEINEQPSESSLSEPLDWSGEELATDQKSLEQDLGTELGNTFDSDTPNQTISQIASEQGNSLIWEVSGGSGGQGASFDDETSNLEAYVAEKQSLHALLLHRVRTTLLA
jgi:RNA polymerase sigma-54 factor